MDFFLGNYESFEFMCGGMLSCLYSLMALTLFFFCNLTYFNFKCNAGQDSAERELI